MDMSDGAGTDFIGAKLILLIGGRLLTLLRDDVPHIPWPGHWDLPGGGREAGESPEDCVIRETREEFGLSLLPGALLWKRRYPSPFAAGAHAYWFAARLPGGAERAIVFGDEGQEWRLMAVDAFTTHPLVVPHFPSRVRDGLAALRG